MQKPQIIRTYLAALIGVLLARLIAAIPAVAESVTYIDGIFAEAGWTGVTTIKIIESLIVAGIILGYQWVAQKLGDRLPRIEAVLLGSSQRPTYDDYLPQHARIED